ncbi:hypothetical protein ACHAXR_010167 [Thalassiosira sp. AJA248-18]
MRREVDPDVYCPQAALVSEELNQRTERRLARYRAKVEAEKLHQQKIMALQQQRQQRMWMAGGTLVAIALSLIWYKRQKGRGKQRRGRGDDLPLDLFLEEDEFKGKEHELQQLFVEAVKVARKFSGGMLDQRDQLMLYGLYKQSREGDRNGDAPSKLNVVAYAKWDAWGKFIGLPKQFAMQKYCEVVYHFSTGGSSSFSEGKGDDDADIVYDDDKQVEVDEDGCPVNGGDAEGMISGMGIRPSTLSGDPDAKSQNETKSTPEVRLRNAAIANDVAVLEEIIGDVCDIDDADEEGQTALHFAADRGSKDCLKLLVETGANVNAFDCDGIGVLQTALSAGLDIDSVRILLEAGADPEARDCDGDSPRMWVSEEGGDDLVELFAAFPAR